MQDHAKWKKISRSSKIHGRGWVCATVCTGEHKSRGLINEETTWGKFETL